MDSQRQASFDELMAASLISLGEDDIFLQFRKSNAGFSGREKSIDEFLHNYRPKLVDLRDFMTFTGPGEIWQDTFTSLQFDAMDHAQCMALQSSFTFSTPEICRNREKNQPEPLTAQKSTCLSTKQQHAAIRKRPYIKLPAEKKMERRKEQNREAQRRFRERHMLHGH